jgi:hypothetical protein
MPESRNDGVFRQVFFGWYPQKKLKIFGTNAVFVLFVVLYRSYEKMDVSLRCGIRSFSEMRDDVLLVRRQDVDDEFVFGDVGPGETGFVAFP